jgi:hypothetical protein
MDVIMAEKLKVRKECLEHEIHFDYHGTSIKVVLKDAAADHLAILKELGVDVFEKPEKEK